MRITELAERVGVTASTIKRYEKLHLLPAPKRDALSGHRRYLEEDVEIARRAIFRAETPVDRIKLRPKAAKPSADDQNAA
jgi:DNA-binding transcriptional MerR regulator